MSRFSLPIALSEDQIRRAVNVLGIVLAAWMCAGIAGQAVASLISSGGGVKQELAERLAARSGDDFFNRRLAREDYNVIVERNLFDSMNRVATQMIEEEEEQAFVERPNLDGPPVPSALPVKLLGTIVSSDPAFSVATVEMSRSNTEAYRIGEKIMGEATITSIERNKIFIINNGKREYLETEENKTMSVLAPSFEEVNSEPAGAGVRELTPGKFVVDRGRIEQVMSNMSQVMTQARVVPHFENGKAAGWKIFAIKPDSIYQELNLQNGDIIQRINGTEIDSPAKALEMYQQLAQQTRVTIDLVRRGSKQTLDYEIR